MVFDRAGYIQDFQLQMGRALRDAGRMAIDMMSRNIMGLSLHDFKGDFKSEVASRLKVKVERETDTIMTLAAGLVDEGSDEWFMIRAHILEYGMGSLADPAGGGDLEPVSHVQGVAGINDTVTGYAPVSNKPTYLLPASWNHPPGHWFEEASILCDEIFDECIERAWVKINPWNYINQEGEW